jgi:DNA polymerase III epsilon subunit-like protein
MALTEKTIIDQIEITRINAIQVRMANIIEKDGKEISKTYHRYVLKPTDDISKEDIKIQGIANSIWTTEVINEYKELINNSNNI